MADGLVLAVNNLFETFTIVSKKSGHMAAFDVASVPIT
jgi:hypothetical protein